MHEHTARLNRREGNTHSGCGQSAGCSFWDALMVWRGPRERQAPSVPEDSKGNVRVTFNGFGTRLLDGSDAQECLETSKLSRAPLEIKAAQLPCWG